MFTKEEELRAIKDIHSATGGRSGGLQDLDFVRDMADRDPIFYGERGSDLRNRWSTKLSNWKRLSESKFKQFQETRGFDPPALNVIDVEGASIGAWHKRRHLISVQRLSYLILQFLLGAGACVPLFVSLSVEDGGEKSQSNYRSIIFSRIVRRQNIVIVDSTSNETFANILERAKENDNDYEKVFFTGETMQTRLKDGTIYRALSNKNICNDGSIPERVLAQYTVKQICGFGGSRPLEFTIEYPEVVRESDISNDEGTYV